MREEVTIRELESDDAPELAALFRRCYGETYGSPIFYDPSALAEAIATRRLRSVVATDGEQLFGHTGITVRHPGSLACETGNTVVDPAMRGRGLLRKLGGALHGLVQREGFIGYLHYPTTAHEIMQRASVAAGGAETGVMLAYVPDTTEYRHIERRAGRIGATVAYQPFAPAPARDVLLPARYRELIESIYERLGLARTAQAARAGGSVSASEPSLVAEHSPSRGALRLFAEHAGRGLADQVATALAQYAPQVTHVDLTLDAPHVDSAIEGLRELGFFFCALLPEFAHTDLLRLQALREPAPEDFEPHVVNGDAKRFCAYMRDEVSGCRA